MKLSQKAVMKISGGVTESVFPSVQDMLRLTPDLSRFFVEMVGREEVRQYNSLMDCLFCEMYPSWRARCFEFYYGKDMALDEYMSPEILERVKERLMLALVFLKKAQSESPQPTWKEVKEKIRVEVKRSS